MTLAEIKELFSMGFSKDEILIVAGGVADVQKTEPKTQMDLSQKTEPAQPITPPQPTTPAQPITPTPPQPTTSNVDMQNMKAFNDNIVNLTKALQASNLLNSYMPQGTTQSNEDLAASAIASIINPTYGG